MQRLGPRHPRASCASRFDSAEDRESLASVFDEIVARVTSFDVPLSDMPPAGEELFVNANDEPVEKDPTNGWTYGESCNRLKSGVIMRQSVSFGCPPPTCMPSEEVCNSLDDDCDDDDAVDEDCLI